jgi:hypothetical protein
MLGTASARELAARLDAPAQQGTIRIDDVRVGRRYRRDPDDLDGLTERRRRGVTAAPAIAPDRASLRLRDDDLYPTHPSAVRALLAVEALPRPPAQAIIKSGVAVKDERGRVAYSPPLLEFRGAGGRRAWSDAVVRSVLAFDGRALDSREPTP